MCLLPLGDHGALYNASEHVQHSAQVKPVAACTVAKNAHQRSRIQYTSMNLNEMTSMDVCREQQWMYVRADTIGEVGSLEATA